MAPTQPPPSRAYTPGQFLSIDESMISFKGHLSFIQYLPKKPHKWGMKAWVLAESTSGYMWNWKLYLGKEEEPAPVSWSTELPLPRGCWRTFSATTCLSLQQCSLGASPRELFPSPCLMGRELTAKYAATEQ